MIRRENPEVPTLSSATRALTRVQELDVRSLGFDWQLRFEWWAEPSIRHPSANGSMTVNDSMVCPFCRSSE